MQLKLLVLLLIVTRDSTEQEKWAKMGKNHIISTIFTTKNPKLQHTMGLQKTA